MLSEFQKAVLRTISERMLALEKVSPQSDEAKRQLEVVAAYAFALYQDLSASGTTIHFKEMMLQNRGVPPTNPEFFNHVHALQDFVGQANAHI